MSFSAGREPGLPEGDKYCVFFTPALSLWVTSSPRFLSFFLHLSLPLCAEWPGFSRSMERPSGSQLTSQAHSSF